MIENNEYHYEIIHDNLNDQWLLVDLSNDKYKFYFKIKDMYPTIHTQKDSKPKKKKLSSLLYNLFI